MISEQQDLDEFGQNRLLSRINRRFSLLIPNLLRLPAGWAGDETGAFKSHLARVNNLALTVLTLGGVLAALLTMVLAIKIDQSALFFIGVAILPAVFLLQYVLGLFCAANLNLSFGPPIQLVSRLIPEVVTVFGFLGFVALGIFGLLSAVASFGKSLQEGLLFTVAVVGSTTVAGLCAWVAANSERLLQLSIEPNERQGPADYLFSIILYIGRYQLILVPYQFLAAMLLATSAILYFGATLILRPDATENALGSLMMLSMFGGSVANLVMVLLLPILAHFVYLLIVTVADIGVAFFRLVKGTETIARLSGEAMRAEAMRGEGGRPDEEG